MRRYKAGGKIVVGNTLLDLSSLDGVQTIRTDRPKDDELAPLRKEGLEATDRLNAGSDASELFFVGPIGFGNEDRDIAEAGPDVTGDFITAAPGSRHPVLHYLEHNWTVTVVGRHPDGCHRRSGAFSPAIA